MMLRTILVPLDGSALAAYALPYAARLARAAGGRLVLVRATPDAPSHQQAEAELGAVAERLFGEGVPAESHVRRGAAGDVILDGARAWEAGLVAMATHGRSGLGRWLYGSVADHVLRHAPVPVLLVSGVCERRWPAASPAPAGPGTESGGQGRVLVPLDGSALSGAALRPAGELAGALGAGLLLVQVVPFTRYSRYAAGAESYSATYASDPEPALDEARRYLEAAAAPLRRAGHDVATAADLGMAAPTIARLAREHDAAAIALATHGRGGLARAVLGSVATGVLQLAGAPVLLARPAESRAAGEAPRESAGETAGEG
jgi:nucleotide-binding universal stress UspA family protein